MNSRKIEGPKKEDMNVRVFVRKFVKDIIKLIEKSG